MGRSHGGEMATIPEGPLTIVSRASADVGATSAMRRAAPDSTRSRMNSAPARVLPNPRPARISHQSQPPGGANCAGLPQNLQS